MERPWTVFESDSKTTSLYPTTPKLHYLNNDHVGLITKSQNVPLNCFLSPFEIHHLMGLTNDEAHAL